MKIRNYLLLTIYCFGALWRVPCGRVLGHGEFCEKGHLCDSCIIQRVGLWLIVGLMTAIVVLLVR